MIAVDTSALMAIALDEPEADKVISVLQAERPLVISAVTVAEALVVGRGRGVGPEIQKLIDRFDFQVQTIDLVGARQAAGAYARWGKGVHPAGLNFVDCFAYALAEQQDCPLLFVGNDFARTDIRSALAP
ncbi:MAG: type II toxin-antitoxin system VapC family toxin [Alphaproteobacteria bacterium]|nr:type II toxin-antitoxin system VapC family toxin [Alphaproteobacteria bacterium]